MQKCAKICEYLHISAYASLEMPLYAGKYVICGFLKNMQAAIV